MTHSISAEEARRLLDEDKQRASREARLKLARNWWTWTRKLVDWGRIERMYTPFGEFTVAELEGE